jgi:hypothetical protein
MFDDRFGSGVLNFEFVGCCLHGFLLLKDQGEELLLNRSRDIDIFSPLLHRPYSRNNNKNLKIKIIKVCLGGSVAWEVVDFASSIVKKGVKLSCFSSSPDNKKLSLFAVHERGE